MIIRKSTAEIETMARAGAVVAETLALLEEHMQPGITTGELDAIAEEHIRSRGGEPTFKGYKGYPAATCLSPNAMVVHGIPGKVKLQDGDILSVDVGVTLDGFVLDGFPRNVAQAEALDSMLGGIGRVLDAILFFAVSDEIGMERALSRAALEGRADDTREVIARRLEIYHRETEPIVEHYRMTGKLIPLHADRSIEQVWTEISNALQQVVSGVGSTEPDKSGAAGFAGGGAQR